MATGYHDDSNNPRYNFVLHRAGSDDERGIPSIGKLVYRTDTPGLEVCTATSPDPTLNGGGTWAGVGGGTWADYTATLSTTSTALNIGSTGYELGRFTLIGNVCHAQIHIGFDGTGVDPGTGFYRFDLPVQQSANALNSAIGYGFIEDQGVTTMPVTVIGSSTASSTTARMIFEGNLVVSFDTPFTWGAGDQIRVFLTYEVG